MVPVVLKEVVIRSLLKKKSILDPEDLGNFTLACNLLLVEFHSFLSNRTQKVLR